MENLQNEYTLTEDEQAMVIPMIEQIELAQKEVQAVLRAITRARKLDGNWSLVGVKLIKAERNGAGPHG
jgi:hypothetical protein